MVCVRQGSLNDPHPLARFWPMEKDRAGLKVSRDHSALRGGTLVALPLLSTPQPDRIATASSKSSVHANGTPCSAHQAAKDSCSSVMSSPFRLGPRAAISPLASLDAQW